MKQEGVKMNIAEMTKLAKELENAANSNGLTLEKVASAALLYESFGMDDGNIDNACLEKVAKRTKAEIDFAAEFGINMAINSFLKVEI